MWSFFRVQHEKIELTTLASDLPFSLGHVARASQSIESGRLLRQPITESHQDVWRCREPYLQAWVPTRVKIDLYIVSNVHMFLSQVWHYTWRLCVQFSNLINVHAPHIDDLLCFWDKHTPPLIIMTSPSDTWYTHNVIRSSSDKAMPRVLRVWLMIPASVFLMLLWPFSWLVLNTIPKGCAGTLACQYDAPHQGKRRYSRTATRRTYFIYTHDGGTEGSGLRYF